MQASGIRTWTSLGAGGHYSVYQTPEIISDVLLACNFFSCIYSFIYPFTKLLFNAHYMPDTVLGIENSTLTMLLIRSLLLSMYRKDKFKDKGKTDNLIQTIRLIFCMPLEHKPL